jgi:hypothetical protein
MSIPVYIPKYCIANAESVEKEKSFADEMDAAHYI